MQGFDKSDFEAYFLMVAEFDKSNPLLGSLGETEELYLYNKQDIDRYLFLLDKFYSDIHDLQYIKQIKIYPVIKKIFDLNPGMENFRLERIRRFLLKEHVSFDVTASRYQLDRVVNRYSPKSGYFFKVTQEFFNYIFVDRNRQNNDKKVLQKKLQEYVDLCAEITSLIDSSNSEKYIQKYMFGDFRINPEKIMEKAASIPIERNSATLAEKVFVQNMISLNTRFYGKPRLNTIQEIMCIPFFNNQFDATTLSRIRRKMQEQQKAFLTARKVQATLAT